MPAATLTPDELPLTPRVTPAFAVGGVILMTSGIVYTIVGIKHKALHVTFSTAYLASLSVAILILYLTNVPVSDAIQGAYLVAIIMAGLILGGVSLYFMEITEGLGALLGGFCFSMWLLVLVPGGLLKASSSIIAFIACFTVVAFAVTFHRLTRPYALIVGIAFAGSTITILGIDCVSRAGLKEFWAYIWNLNSDLFPLGTDTYPITKGIKVEIAAIIVIFLLGLLSQFKIWVIVKNQRDRRAALAAQRRQEVADEEAVIGKCVNDAVQRDQAEWEKTYDDGERKKDSTIVKIKELASSTTTFVQSENDELEMAEMRNASRHNNIEASEAGEIIPAASTNESAVNVGDARLSRSTAPVACEEQCDRQDRLGMTAEAASQSGTVDEKDTAIPSITSAPVAVPDGADSQSNGDRSSRATFNDDNNDVATFERSSSTGHAGVLAGRHNLPTRGPSKDAIDRASNPEGRDIEDDLSSLAATVDFASEAGSLEIEREHEESSNAVRGKDDSSVEEDNKIEDHTSMTSEHSQALATKSHTAQSCHAVEQSVQTDVLSDAHSIHNDFTKPDAITSPLEAVARDQCSTSGKGEELAETKDMSPAAILPGHLPDRLSKVAMSYRTNEWAKHLASADMPAIEDIVDSQPAEEDQSPAPVDVHQLQQTAASMTTPPLSRPVSTNSLQAQTISRTPVSINKVTPDMSLSVPRMQAFRNSSAPSLLVGSTLSESPVEGKLSTFSGSRSSVAIESALPSYKRSSAAMSHLAGQRETLLSQRQSVLRSRSSVGFNDVVTTIPAGHQQQYYGVSSKVPYQSIIPTVPESSSSSFQSSRSTQQSSVSSPSVSKDPRLDNEDLTLSQRQSIIRQNSQASVKNDIYTLPSQTSGLQQNMSMPDHGSWDHVSDIYNSTRQSPNYRTSQVDLTNNPYRSSSNYNFRSSSQQALAEAHQKACKQRELQNFRNSIMIETTRGAIEAEGVENSLSRLRNEHTEKRIEAERIAQRQKELDKRRESQLRAGSSGMRKKHSEAIAAMQRKVKLDPVE